MARTRRSPWQSWCVLAGGQWSQALPAPMTTTHRAHCAPPAHTLPVLQLLTASCRGRSARTLSSTAVKLACSEFRTSELRQARVFHRIIQNLQHGHLHEQVSGAPQQLFQHIVSTLQCRDHVEAWSPANRHMNVNSVYTRLDARLINKWCIFRPGTKEYD